MSREKHGTFSEILMRTRKSPGVINAGASSYFRQRPTLPLPLRSSTIGAGGLNDRVRNGNGCDPSAIAAGKSVVLGSVKSPGQNSTTEWTMVKAVLAMHRGEK